MVPSKYSRKATLIGIIAGILISIGILVLLALWPVQYEPPLIPYQESGAPAGGTGDFEVPDPLSIH